MKTVKTVEYTEFTEADIRDMFCHNAKMLQKALSILQEEPSATPKNVVTSLKRNNLIPHPNYVVKNGNSWMLCWGYEGGDGSLFSINTYGYIRKLYEFKTLGEWLNEHGYTTCNTFAVDQEGNNVNLIGWKELNGNIIVRPLSYPIKHNNIAYIKDDIVHYCKSYKEIA